VLTGDKKETAVNIGYSCKLLSDQMLNLTLDEANIDVSFLFEIDHFVLEMICL
jgi:magnesium-transporting ATPase (P-type)